MSREGSLAKNTAIIALGKICTQFVSFCLLPLYTTHLTAAEYGTVDLFGTYLSLALPLATLMVEQGMFRFLITQNEEGTTRKRIISSSLLIILAINLLFVLLGLLFFPYYKNDYKYYLIPMLISASLFNWCMQMARGFHQLALYSMSSVVSIGISLILNVILISGFEMGAKGMLLALIIGNLCGTVFLIYRLHVFSYLDVREFDTELSGKMLAYSMPLIPNSLSFWLIDYSDRMIVNYFLGISANGILAISHKFPQAIQNVFFIFNIAWYEMGIVHWKDDDRDVFFGKIMDTVVRAFSGMCILVLGFLPLVFHLFVRSTEYQGAYLTIPVYIAAALFNIIVGLYGIVYIASKKTKEIAKTTILAGIINVSLHLLLIKTMGLLAAALSTMFAYLCMMIFRIRDVKKYLKLEINVKHCLFIGLSFTVTGFCYYSSSMMIRFAGFGISVILVSLLNRDSFSLLPGLIKKFLYR